MCLTLEEEVTETMEEAKLAKDVQEAAQGFLAPLKNKPAAGRPHYEHSLRVGLLCQKIARHMRLDEKALLLAGLLHDVGKAQTNPATLGKTEGWSENDYDEIKPHVLDSYRMLRGRLDFTAEIILWHHRFQKNKYPNTIPPPLHEYSEGTRTLIPFYGRLLSLADCYDAFHRVNDKTEGRRLGEDEIREKMIMLNPDQKHLIQELYAADVFGNGLPATQSEEQDRIYELAWKDWQGKRTPEEVARHVMLACALEPLSDKFGCTTRIRDQTPHQRLEYFITGAINIGRAFEILAERFLTEKEQPMLYDLAYKAQLDSKRNRKGGRVNHGIIELFVPIVAAQCKYSPDYRLGADDVLDKAIEVMKNTNRQDVDELIRMRRLAYDLSGYFDRPVEEHKGTNTIFDYYIRDLAGAKKPTNIAHNGEFVNCFPTIKRIYDAIGKSTQPHFVQKAESAYRQARKQMPEGTAAGFIADCIAAGIYLQLSEHPKEKLVR